MVERLGEMWKGRRERIEKGSRERERGLRKGAEREREKRERDKRELR